MRKTVELELFDVDISKIVCISKIKSSGTQNQQWYFFTVMVECVDINSKVNTDKKVIEDMRAKLVEEWKNTI